MQSAYLQEFLQARAAAAVLLHAARLAARRLTRRQTVRDTCFDKCITRPSSSMSSGEVTCLARCCDRYLEVRDR